MKYIGAHVSTSGGVDTAPRNAHAIGADAFALFTRNQRQWNPKPLSPAHIASFRETCTHLGFGPAQILAHDGYLINLGHPDEEGLMRSRAAFIDEMKRCAQLGIRFLNFHPGSHLGKISEEECLSRIAASVNLALEQVAGVTAVIENTAGQGSNVGYRFEHLSAIISQINYKDRVGVCLDTAHAFASGYDIASEAGYEAMWDKFDRIIGFHYLRGMHLNDTKKSLGSRVDRHEHLGDGILGVKVFERIMRDHRLDGIPFILETPDETRWAEEINLLRSFLS